MRCERSRDAKRWSVVVRSNSRWPDLPVIDTLRKLLDTGDQIHTIDGCPSGTLRFSFFAELNIAAKDFRRLCAPQSQPDIRRPDPRLDLSGVDVARKALILAPGRFGLFRGDLCDVFTDNLISVIVGATFATGTNFFSPRPRRARQCVDDTLGGWRVKRGTALSAISGPHVTAEGARCWLD